MSETLRCETAAAVNLLNKTFKICSRAFTRRVTLWKREHRSRPSGSEDTGNALMFATIERFKVMSHTKMRFAGNKKSAAFGIIKLCRSLLRPNKGNKTQEEQQNETWKEDFRHWGEVTPVWTYTHVHRLVGGQRLRRKLREGKSRIGRVGEFQQLLVQHLWRHPEEETEWPALSRMSSVGLKSLFVFFFSFFC